MLDQDPQETWCSEEHLSETQPLALTFTHTSSRLSLTKITAQFGDGFHFINAVMCSVHGVATLGRFPCVTLRVEDESQDQTQACEDTRAGPALPAAGWRWVPYSTSVCPSLDSVPLSPGNPTLLLCTLPQAVLTLQWLIEQ